MYLSQFPKVAVRFLFRKGPIEAQLIVTRKCNLSCGYCNEYDTDSLPVPFEVLAKRIDVLHRLGTINISLLGGEPLLHPQLDKIVYHASRNSMCSITTNGFLLTREWIERLNRAGLGNLQLSIDSLNPDPSFFIQKSLKTLLPKFDLLKKYARFNVHATIVLCEQSRSQYRAILDRLRSLGIPVSVNLVHDETGKLMVQGNEYVELWDYHYQKSNLFSDIEYDYGRNLLSGKTEDWHCRSGSRFLYVDEFGKAQYCSSQLGRLEKDILDYGPGDLAEQSAIKKGCERGCSQMCVYRDSSIDNDRWRITRMILKFIFKGMISIWPQKSPGFAKSATAPS